MDDLFKQLGAEDLTPVQNVDGIYFKRDDLFAPFGADSVNGGKLRQGAYLLSKAIAEGYTGILSGSSINSPQSPMVAALCQHFGLKCTILYGGTNETSLKEKSMPQLVKHFGATIKIVRSGRANVLHAEAKKLKTDKDFIVAYGMNSQDPKCFTAFYETTANQVQNIPDELEALVITCGSGITSAGVIYGIKKYNKKVNRIILIGNAPNRVSKVKDRLDILSLNTGVNCWTRRFEYIDLFKDIPYDTRYEDVRWGDIEFHPHYEAKAFTWFKENMLNTTGEKLFWIVGKEPKL